MRLFVRTQNGFTLIEALTVIALIALVGLLASPSLTRLMVTSQISGAADTLFAHLLYTRNEAVTRNARLVMCKSSDASRCATTGGWEQGWIVFHDRNENALRDQDENIVSVVQALPRGVRIFGNGPVDSYVSYVPSGRAIKTSGAYQIGTLTVCSVADGSMRAKQLIISSSGRVRAESTKARQC